MNYKIFAPEEWIFLKPTHIIKSFNMEFERWMRPVEMVAGEATIISAIKSSSNFNPFPIST